LLFSSYQLNILSYSFFSTTPPTAILSEGQILQLRNNNVTDLDINLVDKGLNDTSIDWAELGQLISPSTTLKTLTINGNFGINWKSRERSRQLFKSIALSTSIENLALQNLGSGSVIHLPLCIKSLANNLRSLEFWNCYNMGKNEYDALAKLLKDPDCIVEILALSGCDFMTHFRETVRDALELNTSVKKLHIEREYLSPIAWTCRCSAIEELILIDFNMNNKELTEIGCALKDNTTLKVLGLYFGQVVNTEGWAAFAASLCNNALVELDLSDNTSINNEVLTGLMSELASNTTLSTLRLENLGNVTREGWRSITTYIRSPTCALENLYIGQNILDGGTFRDYSYACQNNRTLKNLCLKLPTTAQGINTPRIGWNPWMNMLTRIVYNKRSIIETYNSNHVLEAICYPHEEERFARDMSTCPLLGKSLPTYLLMNRSEQDKFALARKKIMEAHYLSQDVVTDNRRYRGYRSLMETILETTDNMERTEQLPNIMSWTGRDNDGLSLMYELIQRMPSLCESVGMVIDTSANQQLRSSKRKRND